MPTWQIGVEGDYDPVTLRELAENDLSPRSSARRRRGGHDQRRPSPPGPVSTSRRKKSLALNLSVDRVVQALRSENQNLPLGQIDQGDSTYLVRSQGQFVKIDDIANLVVLTRQNVPVYLKDVADVRDATEDRRSSCASRHAMQREAWRRTSRRPDADQQTIGREHRVGRAGHPRRIARINRDVPGGG